MKRFFITSVLLFALVLTGCSHTNTGLSGDGPPDVSLNINGKIYGTNLGSYCWSSVRLAECVDTVGPEELIEDKEPIKVQPGEQILLVIDFEPKPNSIHLSMIEDGNETDVEIRNQTFTAPRDKGTYYYVYSVRWMDEIEENISHGDAFYAFPIVVQ